MADQSIVPLDLQAFPNCIAPPATAALAAGSVVRVDGTGAGVAAQATSVANARVRGVALRSAAAKAPVYVRYIGPVDLSTDEWDAIAGTTGGLTPNAPYFLSAATAGHLTDAAPGTAGQVDIQVGVAISPTVLMVDIQNAELAAIIG